MSEEEPTLVEFVVGIKDMRNGDFGHNRLILVSDDRRAWEVHAMLLSPAKPWVREGFTFRAQVDAEGNIVHGTTPFSFEIPRRMPKPPEGVFQEAWNRAGHMIVEIGDINAPGRGLPYDQLKAHHFRIPKEVISKLQSLKFVGPKGEEVWIKNRNGT